MKQRIIFVIVLLTAGLLLMISAEAEIIAGGTCNDGVAWTVTDEGSLSIIGTGPMLREVTYTPPWSEYGQSITSVEIGEGVTDICNNAFSGFSMVTEVSIPSTVKRIGYRSFNGCSELTGINLPFGVTEIDSYAFYSCGKLSEITIPDSLISIGSDAFRSCGSLQSIFIPDGVTEIGRWAFSDCNAVRYANIGSAGAIALGKSGYSFRTYGSAYDLKYLFSDGAVSDLELNAVDAGITEIVVPDDVTSIAGRALRSCSSTLVGITLPDTVTKIDDHAFWWCNKLTQIRLPDGITHTGEEPFYGCGAKLFADADTDTARSLSKAGYSFIAPGAKYSQQYLYTGDQITGMAISDVDKTVTTFTVPEGVTHLGNQAFYQCENLGEVNLPASLKSIGDRAFYKCGKLKSISIPETVTEIGEYAFEYCTWLKEINIPDGITVISKGMFSDCPNLTNIVLPAGLKKIESYSFNDCTGLESISIPDGVTEIGETAFQCCNALTHITIPYGITTIKRSVFGNCYGLTSVTIPDSVTTICEYAFGACRGLQSITIPESVTCIEERAFSACEFSWVSIPAGVASVGKSAFGYNDRLRRIAVLGSETELGLEMFSCTDVSVYCHRGSAAAEWADSQGYTVHCFEDLSEEDGYSVEMPSSIRLGCGQSMDLEAKVFPINDQSLIRWSVDKPEIVSVEDGVVTALSQGTAMVTAVCGNVSKSVSITTYIPAESFELAQTEIYGIVGQWIQAPEAICNPENSQVFLSWDFHCVGDFGSASSYRDEIKCDKPCDVLMQGRSNEGRFVTCVAHVFYPVTKIQFEQDELLIPTGVERQLTAIVTMRDQQLVNRLVVFTSSDESVVRVDQDGRIYALGAGKATVTAASQSGKTAEVSVHVVDPCENHTSVTDMTVPATCTESGLTEGAHCSVCGAILVPQEVIPIRDHDWGEVVYTWSDDLQSLTAKRVCGYNENHSETETVRAYVRITKAADCEVPGEQAYVSGLFINPAFLKQTSAVEETEPKGHLWRDASYTWADDLSEVTVACTCGRNEEHRFTESVIPAKVVTKMPTEDEPGILTYRAVFANPVFTVQERTEEISSLADISLLILPSDLTTIEGEAFAGVSANAVVIPDTVETITGNPFVGSGITMVFGRSGSSADTFANTYGLFFIPIAD